jgi:hypothetical protein
MCAAKGCAVLCGTVPIISILHAMPVRKTIPEKKDGRFTLLHLPAQVVAIFEIQMV